MSRPHRCEIAEYPTATFTASAPSCGAGATWWSDDLGPVTVWMCDEHAKEVLQCTDARLEVT
ncbi:MAG: hypothetical protein DLM65_11455 [Candidatus Aeolococcus gillhamiae]|uniref:Uncharacterized protein n=1 Tax=Candidatus Aeolococcus gillhamiae TaxID=3127015 RepID=A0A2W6A0R7_9BACT|nr:MAG: hypothetical protein DLM65_11455 [Candidatus Dormibacter sp. RRmetagenome_bin12]